MFVWKNTNAVHLPIHIFRISSHRRDYSLKIKKKEKEKGGKEKMIYAFEFVFLVFSHLYSSI